MVGRCRSGLDDRYGSSVLLQLDQGRGEVGPTSVDQKPARPAHAKRKLDPRLRPGPTRGRARLPFALKALGVLAVRWTEDEGDRLAQGSHEAQARSAQKRRRRGPGQGPPKALGLDSPRPA